MISSTEDECSSSDSDSDYDLSDPEAGMYMPSVDNTGTDSVGTDSDDTGTGAEKQSHLLDLSLSPILPSTHVLPQSSTPGDSVTPRGRGHRKGRGRGRRGRGRYIQAFVI